MTAPLILTGLTKYYGTVRGIEDLDLEVRAGEIFGFLGPNGAGKSTTISTILDFIRPTRGTATVLGMDSRRDSVAIHASVGYLAGELAMYDKMTGREMLGYLASLRNINADTEIAALARRFDLDLDRKIRTYSVATARRSAWCKHACIDPNCSSSTSRPTASTPLSNKSSTHYCERSPRKVGRCSCRRTFSLRSSGSPIERPSSATGI